ncbi:MAG: helix-hairpin-helix domain-containing protein [Bacteroidia bacterium]|nr:helix-hairpin-helix domain-containing protein [Bacteroidia bacterium]MDW8235729.1 helix-hairpin-helix domain-containing protein [Bacteroidia bacterium]
MWHREWLYRLRQTPPWHTFVLWTVVPSLLAGLSFYTKKGANPASQLALYEPIEVNTADSLILLALPGFTPYRVSRLLQTRRELGSLWDMEEVEILLDSALFHEVSSFLQVATDSLPAPLNLNQVDSAALVRAKLCRPNVARKVVRYRMRIGGYTTWSQLDSLWGLREIERYRLRKYTFLGRVSAPSYPRLNINQATAEELEKLPGIGMKTAERIVRYRSKLKYFVSLDQLREVWGLREENLRKALPYLWVGQPTQSPLSLRRSSVEELAAHPYISWRLARFLVRQREQWGSDAPIPPSVWQSWLPDSLCSKLIPYLQGE